MEKDLIYAISALLIEALVLFRSILYNERDVPEELVSNHDGDDVFVLRRNDNLLQGTVSA